MNHRCSFLFWIVASHLGILSASFEGTSHLSRRSFPQHDSPKGILVSSSSSALALWKTNKNDNSIEDDDEKTKKGRRRRKQKEYDHRKQLWMERYGSAEALERTFGSLSNSTLLDRKLTPQETRRLYHALLPRSLLALYELEILNPQELAPLAYEARIAAKEYARSQSSRAGQIMTSIVDGYRKVNKKNNPTNTNADRSNNSNSMTWDEVWEKYEAQIVQEECVNLDKDSTSNLTPKEKDALTMKIYTRILEKSCATNPAIDRLFLEQKTRSNAATTTNNNRFDDSMAAAIAAQLEDDVRQILLSPKQYKKANKRLDKLRKQKEKADQKALQREQKQQQKFLKQEEKRIRKKERARAKNGSGTDQSTSDKTNNITSHQQQKQLPPLSWETLRILAGTRRNFRRLQK